MNPDVCCGKSASLVRAAGIDCILELPEVGNNLCEHPMTSLTYTLARVPSAQAGVSLVAIFPFCSLVSDDELEKKVAQVEQVASLSEVERGIVSRLRDPASGTIQLNGTSAFIDIKGGYDDHSKLLPDTSDHERTYYSFHVSITSTLSEGSTHITCCDPLAAPAIDLGLLKEEADVSLLAAGLEFADRVFSSSYVSGQVVKRVVPSPDINLQSRNEGRRFVRNWTVSFNHILGTCAMGRVVDSRLRVKGILGLRVVDASVIPTQISGNVLATVYAVAEGSRSYQGRLYSA